MRISCIETLNYIPFALQNIISRESVKAPWIIEYFAHAKGLNLLISRSKNSHIFE